MKECLNMKPIHSTGFSNMDEESVEEILHRIQHTIASLDFQYSMIKYTHGLKNAPEGSLLPSESEFISNMDRWVETFQPFASTDIFRADAGLALFAFDGAWKSDACSALSSMNASSLTLHSDTRIVNPIPIKKTAVFKKQNTSNQSRPVTPPPSSTRNVADITYLSPEERARNIIRNSLL
jgi:hypothetical protein